MPKSQFLPLALESKDSGFRAILSSSALDLGDDMVSNACIEDAISQVRNSAATFKGSYLHDAIIQKNPNLPPLSKMDVAQHASGALMEMIGTWNEAHPEWSKIKPMIDNGMLDGISIEYIPEKFSRMEKDGKVIRILEKIKLLGYGHVPRPMNMDAAIREVFQKSFDQFKEPEPSDDELVLLDGSNSEVGPKMEVNTMDETKTVSFPVSSSTSATTTTTDSAEMKQEQASAPESKASENEVIQLKAQLEAQRKELEEVKARLSDKAYIEEIKSAVLAQVKELQPENKILIPSETKVAESLMKAEFSDYIAARAAMGG